MSVKFIEINEFGGSLRFKINFNIGLNIISGENGTGKTRLLQAIKSGNPGLETFSESSYNSEKTYAINPKRNSQRREVNQIIQQIRRDNRSFANFSQDAVNKHFNNNGFDNYSSFGELFMFYFDKLDRSGGDRIDNMNAVVTEFNNVIAEIFSEYKISAKWDSNQGLPLPSIIKRNQEIPITGLSCGEDELFSLVLNLYTLRDEFDLFLIDEPETHLNWHLEKLLFTYLFKFTEQYNKQLIVATHSRIVVDKFFKDYTQFLIWEESGIIVSKNLPAIQREKLVDDAYEILKIGGFEELTIFCEDESHSDYFNSLLCSLGIESFRIAQCGDCSNVKSLYRTSQSDGGWENCIFVIDGDNQGQWKDGKDNFFQLTKYCIENYAFNIEELVHILSTDVEKIKRMLLESIKSKKKSLFKKTAALDFLIELLDIGHLTQERLNTLDASAYFLDFIEKFNIKKRKDFWDKVFSSCSEQGINEYHNFVYKPLFEYIVDWAEQKNQLKVKIRE